MSSFQSPHVKHKSTTQMVKIQGVMIDEPSRRVVSVYDEDDWREIHRNPSVRVGCRMVGCETLLTPKAIARTGTRFFATRSGGCTHFEVKRLTSAVGGGGEETKEHDWVKGRLARIAQKVGLEAIIEESKTRADVYLPGPRIALEYQRVATDFSTRTMQRTLAGAGLTLWLIRQPPNVKGPRSKLRKMFDEQVYQRGGLYISVVDVEDYAKQLRPWEDPMTLNRRARIRIGGSVVQLLPDGTVFSRRSESFAAFLADVVSGARVLRKVPIRPASGGMPSANLAWVRATELQRFERERAAKIARAAAPETEVGEGEPVMSEPVTVDPVQSVVRGDVLEVASHSVPEEKPQSSVAPVITPEPTARPWTLPTPPVSRLRPIPAWKRWLERHFGHRRR
jgi:hypothetical protein